MRLIDADALLNRMQKDPLFDLVERYGVSGVIDAEPTVDAVPVSFIEELIQLSEKVGAEKYAEHLGYLLDDWAERKEE